MRGNSLLRESLSSYHKDLVLVRASIGLALDNHMVVAAADAVVQVGGRLVLFGCRSAQSVGGPLLHGPTIPPRRQGRLVGVWWSPSMSVCLLTA